MNVIPIKNIEEFFKQIEEARNKADNSVEPWQTEMKNGDYFIRVWSDEDWQVHVGPLIIYGEIVPLEYEEDRYLYSQPRMKNVRWAMCYSTLCEEGEPGGIHVGSMTFKLSPEQFVVAKNTNWPNQLEFIYNILNMSRGGDA
jgi:hypothetical protein